MHQLAIYDMDKTITVRPTYAAFLLHAARSLAPWRLALAPLAAVTGLAYALKLIDRGRLKELNQRLLLGPHLSREELAPVAAAFAERTVAGNVHPGALERLAADRADGCHLILATASYRLYAEAIATRLGMDAVIATNSVAGLDARLRPRIDGENCYGPAKLRMIQAWLAANGIARSDARIRFYSDHASDEPVLAWADQPFAVNPHEALRSLAERRGWPVLRWDGPSQDGTSPLPPH